MSKDSLRELQILEFDILKKVVSICKAYHLKYYLAEGTLLGAVRHNGFIPWDDDIDICMPREDFEKFANIAINELPLNYICKFRHDTDIWGTMRISNKSHKICREMNDRKLKLFVSIDIFPIDGFPKNKIKQKLHWIRLLFRFAMFKFTQFDQIDMKKERSLLSYLVIVFAAWFPVWKLFDKRTELQKLTTALKAYPYSSSENVINFFSEYSKKDIGLPQNIMDKKLFGEGKLSLFENEYLIIPKDAEKVLEKEYGDYMLLPPLQERQPKHNITLCK